MAYFIDGQYCCGLAIQHPAFKGIKITCSCCVQLKVKRVIYNTVFFVFLYKQFLYSFDPVWLWHWVKVGHERNRYCVLSLGQWWRTHSPRSHTQSPAPGLLSTRAFYTAENTILYYLALKTRTGCASFSFWITIFTSLTVSPQMIKLVSQDEMQWLQNN